MPETDSEVARVDFLVVSQFEIPGRLTGYRRAPRLPICLAESIGAGHGLARTFRC
jgi:hypothetical protein